MRIVSQERDIWALWVMGVHWGSHQFVHQLFRFIQVGTQFGEPLLPSVCSASPSRLVRRHLRSGGGRRLCLCKGCLPQHHQPGPGPVIWLYVQALTWGYLQGTYSIGFFVEHATGIPGVLQRVILLCQVSRPCY